MGFVCKREKQQLKHNKNDFLKNQFDNLPMGVAIQQSNSVAT